ncbi:hypothetical protein ACFVFQ_04515 [Streptomyces sp. NPDC057743]|uniref:hypothetical protein n=1 Tax=Streptomyces sp. NPDC057743 TaxID=3346236 RepID=UPI00368F0B46
MTSVVQAAYNLPKDAGTSTHRRDRRRERRPDAEKGLASYRTQYGLPECTTSNGCFKKIDQDGGTNYPAPEAGWAGEISLDVDMVSASCPQCHILLVEAKSANMDDVGAAVNQAAKQGPILAPDSPTSTTPSPPPTAPQHCPSPVPNSSSNSPWWGWSPSVQPLPSTPD